MAPTFTHLHIHTHYSLLDGLIDIKKLVARVKELGMASVAITDHGWMAGALKFYKECKKQGVIPILGAEAYITYDADLQEQKNRDNYHLVLLAKDVLGYKMLVRLLSEAALENFYYKPRINANKLAWISGHAIALSACLAGELPQLASWDGKKFSDPEGKVLHKLKFYMTLFPSDFYLEVQDWDDGSGKQPSWNKFVLDYLIPNSGVKPVITTDAHYLDKEDFEVHELTMALQLKTTLKEYREGSIMRYGPWFWLKPPDMMLESAKKLGCEGAFYNTEEIAAQCSGISLELGKYQRPPTPDIEKMEDYGEFLEWKRHQPV